MEATIGRIVHYSPRGKGGQCRAAIVVQAWAADVANLHVFYDGANDFPQHQMDVFTNSWETSVHEGGGENTWHDPRECPNAVKAEGADAPIGGKTAKGGVK